MTSTPDSAQITWSKDAAQWLHAGKHWIAIAHIVGVTSDGERCAVHTVGPKQFDLPFPAAQVIGILASQTPTYLRCACCGNRAVKDVLGEDGKAYCYICLNRGRDTEVAS